MIEHIGVGDMVKTLNGRVGEVTHIIETSFGQHVTIKMLDDGLEYSKLNRTLTVIRKAEPKAAEPVKTSVTVTRPFFVEAYDTYYPSGGTDDIKGSFESVEDAEMFASTNGHTNSSFCNVLKITERGEFDIVSSFRIGEGWKRYTPNP